MATIGAKTSAIMPMTASILAQRTRFGVIGAVATKSGASSPEIESHASPPGELTCRHHHHRYQHDKRVVAVMKGEAKDRINC